MSEDADYQPAITMADAKPAPAAQPRTAFATPEPPVAAALPSGDIPLDPTMQPGDLSRGPRVVTDKVKGMLRKVAQAAAETGDDGVAGIADDLVPMATDAAPAPATAPGHPAAPAAPGPLPTAALPQLHMPTPALAPPAAGGTAADDQRRALLDQREKQLEARHAALEERAKSLPSLEQLAENPAVTITSWLKTTFGITDAGELKTLVGDIMTEASEQLMEAKLPPELKAQLDGRKAVRSVRALRSVQETEKQRLEAQRIEMEKTAKADQDKRDAEASERQLVEHIGAQLAPHAATWKFLHDQFVTGGASAGAIVHEVWKEQRRLHSENPTAFAAPDLATAAKFADDYYRTKAENAVKSLAHLQSLLAPTAAPAAQPVRPQPSTGGVPGPTPTEQPKPAPTPQPTADRDPSELDYPQDDRQERRHRSLANLKTKLARLAGGAA